MKGYAMLKRRRLNPNLLANLKPFKPGEHRVGRKPGTPNKFTQALKDICLEAITIAGFDGKGKGGAVGYLKRIAINEPALMVGLLNKILPMQVTGANGGPLQVMP